MDHFAMKLDFLTPSINPYLPVDDSKNVQRLDKINSEAGAPVHITNFYELIIIFIDVVNHGYAFS